MTELNEVSSGIDEMINMDDFTGTAADSAKGYFQNVHQTTVLALQQLLIEIDNNLKKHIKTFHSDVDTSEKAKVDTNYLEEVKEEIETPFESFVKVNDNIIETIDDVTEIVSITKPDMSKSQSYKDSSVELIEELMSNVETYTTTSNERVKEMIHHVKALMKEIQSHKGEARFRNVYKSELIDPIKELMMHDDGMFATVLEKVANNEPLTPKEQSLLYYIFQNVVLNDDTKGEINDITDYMTEKNIDKLKDRLNEKVIHSQKALDKEIGIIQAYLYLGDMRPSESEISRSNRQKLTSYLMLLKNYDQALNNSIDPAIHVGTLEYEKNRDGIPGHYLYSELEYAIIPKLPYETKEAYRNRVFHPDKLDKVYIVADIRYFIGSDAASEKNVNELGKLQNKEATYKTDFVTGKITEKMFSAAAELGKIPLLYELASDYEEYIEGKRELTNDMIVYEGLDAAGRLGMEFGLTETKDQRGRGAEVSDIIITPTETTFQMLDRWEEAREVYPEMPFPVDALAKENWYEVSETFQAMKVEYGEDMSDFIRGERLEEEETIEDIEIEKD